MDQHNYDKQNTLNDLVSEYEAMSQKGTVAFYEETVFTQIIGYYQNEKAIDRALSVVDLAITQHCYSANLHCKKAELLAFKGYEPEALDALQYAELLSPNDLEVQLFKAEVLGRLGKCSQGLSILEDLKVSFSKHNSKELAEVYFSEGIIYEFLQQYDTMFSCWKETLMLNPGHEDALDKIWVCVELSRKFKESIDLCHRIIDHDPYNQFAWFNLGHAHTYFGDYSQAIEAYEYAFIIDNKFECAYRECAELCMEIKDYKKALECFEEILVHFPPDGDILFRIGQCYHFTKNIAIAKEFYTKALRLDNLNDEIYFHLGECAASLKDWKKATHFYKRAIEIEDKREEYYAALAEVFVQQGQFEEAFKYFDQAAELAPEDPAFWVRFASFLMELGALEEALGVLEDAEDCSVGAEIYYCKAACLFKMGKKKRALNTLGEALMENFEIHGMLFHFQPELEGDPQIQSIIDFYKDAE